MSRIGHLPGVGFGRDFPAARGVQNNTLGEGYDL